LEEQSKGENALTPVSTSPALSTRSTESSAAQSSEKDKIEVKREGRRYYGRQYISHPGSTFNVQNYVEEHPEKVIESDGETRIAPLRRLGDRWYENEIHIDKDGKKTERETWHNVADGDIEKFKLEWRKKGSGMGCSNWSTRE
jgi:hypothetical protein